MLNQTTTPDPDGRFPATGTLTFTSASSCTLSAQLSGTVSGVGFTLQSPAPDLFVVPDVRVYGFGVGTIASFSSVNSNLTLGNGPCGHDVYSGILKRD